MMIRNGPRDGVPASDPSRWDRVQAPLMLAAGLAAWTLWLHWPAIGGDGPGLMGDNADAIMSAWTLDWARSGRMVGPWTWHINPPRGAIAVPGGGITARCLIPISMLLGPTTGYDAGAALVLAAGAFAVAWLIRETTGSWPLGALAGAALAGQPALLRLVRSGTLEHLAFWPLPAGIAALLRALRHGDKRWAVLGGMLLSLLPSESGYAIVYALLVAPAALLPAAWATWRHETGGRTRVIRTLVWGGMAAAPLLIATGLLFALADTDQLQGLGAAVAARNSLDLRSWHDFTTLGGWADDARRSLGAFAAPETLLLLAALSFAGMPRSLPWILVSVVSTGLALGPGAANPTYLDATLGAFGRAIGVAAAGVNGVASTFFPFSHIRFPWRWTVPALLAAFVAASLGLARFRTWSATRRLPRVARAAMGVTLGLLAATISAHAAGHRRGLSRIDLPEVTACRWIRAQRGNGAVLLLPTFRQPMDGGNGVFARLGKQLTGLDWMWLQLQHGRPQNFLAENVPTLVPLGPPGPPATDWIEEADAIAVQGLAGVPVSRSRVQGWMDSDLPHRGVEAVRRAGYRFIMADRTAYPGDWLRALQFLLGDTNRPPLIFSDGNGIAVFDLDTPATRGTATR